METSVEPVRFAAVSMVRYGAREFPPDRVPEDLRGIPLGIFEYEIDGTWRFGRGSYMSPEGPMVWVESEAAP